LLSIRYYSIIKHVDIFYIIVCGGREMQMYKIAGLNIFINGGGALLAERAEPYRIEDACVADFVIEVPQEHLQQMHLFHPNLTENECAYITTGDKFCYHLINYGGFRLHASAVVLDGHAYLFSAPSGTGKSTHTALWCDYFGPDRAYILNDDAPVIKRLGNTFMAWGSPWSGTSPLNRNTGVPLKAIAFLEQSKSNWIRSMDFGESIIHLMKQTRRTNQPKHMEKLMSLLESLLMTVPIYRLGCTMGYGAVETAYAAMSK
jgi:hypothetical protein